ncbi:phosphate-starvation-inducible PsiE family protein [Thaumasiovibrio subtropicus]|uniref:phosphate-starvation-inducible PsiE family protein n=1 Tax=Thaumasiovibrio subtropicus TaxID=1891207 RepID=UPI000B350A0A|nr:phosphate-starvation-inducible PsiE family protein [Thaumasiovibrio subtropicus]
MKQHTDDKMIDAFHRVIHLSVKLLALFMVVLIVMGVLDVGWTMAQKLMHPPHFVLKVSDLLALFGAFMAVLIAIEIFINITVYLREEVIHVKIVIATALMAAARKVIVLDLEKYDAWQVASLALVFFAASFAYWFVHQIPSKDKVHETLD